MAEFKPMVKMMTTEPSVILKLKKGGSVAHPKKMAMGGMPRSMPPAVARKISGLTPGRMKDGGELESPLMHAKEKKAISNVEKKLSKHADMPASKGHKGLKTGGVEGSRRLRDWWCSEWAGRLQERRLRKKALCYGGKS